MNATHEVYVGVGTNLGDRCGYLDFAIEALSQIAEIVNCSSVYRSAAVGGPRQPDYFNMVLWCRTSAGPHQFLTELQRVETAAGRSRMVKNGPRTLDLDLLLYDNDSICDARLTVPHPQMARRRFVLEPLLEVNPALWEIGPLSWIRLWERVQEQEVERMAAQFWLCGKHG